MSGKREDLEESQFLSLNLEDLRARLVLRGPRGQSWTSGGQGQRGTAHMVGM